jgi:hypothetical protein
MKDGTLQFIDISPTGTISFTPGRPITPVKVNPPEYVAKIAYNKNSIVMVNGVAYYLTIAGVPAGTNPTAGGPWVTLEAALAAKAAALAAAAAPAAAPPIETPPAKPAGPTVMPGYKMTPNVYLKTDGFEDLPNIECLQSTNQQCATQCDANGDCIGYIYINNPGSYVGCCLKSRSPSNTYMYKPDVNVGVTNFNLKTSAGITPSSIQGFRNAGPEPFQSAMNPYNSSPADSQSLQFRLGRKTMAQQVQNFSLM